MTDKYVRDMNPQELRAHMRRLQAMPGWHDPLADSMYAEIQRLDLAMRDAHLAGMERAAEIADEMQTEWITREECASAIRAEIKEQQ